MKLLHTLAAASLSLAALSPAVAAEFWTIIPGSHNLTNTNTSGSGFASVATNQYSGAAGQFSGSYYAATNTADSFFRYFCIEIGQSAAAGPLSYASSVWASSNAQKLYDVAYPNKTAGDFWNGAQTNFGVFANSTQNAAFQLALWKIRFDAGNLNLTTGTFTANNILDPVSAQAQTWLNAVSGYSGSGYLNWTVYQFTNPTGQDYASAIYRVSEPGALALLGLSLVGVAAVRRRRAQ